MLGASAGIEDRDARVLLFDDAGAGALDGKIRRKGEDPAAGRHDLARDDMAELDGAVNHGLLKRGKKAHAAAGGGDKLELFRRVHGAFSAERRAEQAQHKRGRPIHQADGRTAYADKRIHRSGDSERNTIRALEGERLGDKFAKQDFKIGDEGKG